MRFISPPHADRREGAVHAAARERQTGPVLATANGKRAVPQRAEQRSYFFFLLASTS